MTDRVNELIAQFDGAIKYGTMLQSKPDMTDAQCLAYAAEQHAVAVAGLRAALKTELEGGLHWWDQTPGWNDRIAFCRNMPTAAMLKEAFDGLK